MKYNGTNLKEVLEAHLRWLKESEGWTNYDRADLRGAYLSGADLRGADLSGADLSGADLRDADLSDADLSDADLSGADLSGADLSGADLRGVNLRGVNLSGADLSGADLRGVNLSGAKNIPFIPMACPDTGAFIGWKKCHLKADGSRCIVKLLIPEDASRLSGSGRKCRASKAVVLEIQTLDGKKLNTEAESLYKMTFIYRVGATVEPDMPFDADRWNECSSGIHFFINRQEAVDY